VPPGAAAAAAPGKRGLGWGRGAARDLEAGAFGVMPAPGAAAVDAAPPPIETAASLTARGSNNLEMARSGSARLGPPQGSVKSNGGL
jgi:hypothetical protein